MHKTREGLEYAEDKEEDKKIETAFIQAQGIWIEYRDAYCKVFELKYKDGSIMPVMYYGTMISLTKSRIEELKILLEELEY